MRLWRRLRAITITGLVRAAAVLTILALGLMVWSLLDPSVLPVMLAMSVGQLFGTIAFGMYVVAIIKDLRRARAARDP